MPVEFIYLIIRGNLIKIQLHTTTCTSTLQNVSPKAGNVHVTTNCGQQILNGEQTATNNDNYSTLALKKRKQPEGRCTGRLRIGQTIEPPLLHEQTSISSL